MGSWVESATSGFLSQHRAHSTLRRELDALIAAFETIVEQHRASEPDRTFEVHASPYRVVVRLDEVAVSFSWVDGSMRTVGDGRLMVIAWGGVAAKAKGVAALKTASPIGESSYAAEATDAASWAWRTDDDTRQTYSTANLAAEWVARATAARASGSVR